MIVLASAISAGYGGVQTLSRLVVEAASDGGIRGPVIALHDNPGAEWTRTWPAARCASGSRLRFLVGALAERAHARRSVIVVTHLGLAPVGRLLKQLEGGGLIVFIHGVEAWGRLPRRTQWALRRCDCFIGVSEYTLTRFRDAHPQLSAIPATVCHLPARRLGTSWSAERPPSEDRPLRVLTVGRLWGRGLRKGQRELIRVWSRICAEFPGAELWIVGEGAGRPELDALARACGVHAAVKLPGGVTDAELARLYATCDVFAMPSVGEGFGLVFAEAMSFGLPCIASRADAGREVVLDGETGLLVDAGDETQLLDALRRLLPNPELRERLGAAGRRRAATQFSLARFNRQLQSILRGKWSIPQAAENTC